MFGAYPRSLLQCAALLAPGKLHLPFGFLKLSHLILHVLFATLQHLVLLCLALQLLLTVLDALPSLLQLPLELCKGTCIAVTVVTSRRWKTTQVKKCTSVAVMLDSFMPSACNWFVRIVQNVSAPIAYAARMADMRKGSRQQERQHSVLLRKTLHCIAAVCIRIQLMLAVRGSLGHFSSTILCIRKPS